MAQSTCPKCGNTSFELKEKEISGSKFKINFIQCSHCGCVIGVQEFYNIGYLVRKLAEELHVNLD